MKITIEIQEEEIRDEVKRIIVERLTEDIYGKKRLSYDYKRDVRDVAREVMREALKGQLFEEMTAAAIEAAAVTIANRAKNKFDV